MGYSISEIASILIKRLWIIVLCISLSTVGAFAVTKLIIDEKYTTSVSMYVAPNTSDEGIYASLNVLNYAKQVVDTYIEILYTNEYGEQGKLDSGQYRQAVT